MAYENIQQLNKVPETNQEIYDYLNNFSRASQGNFEKLKSSNYSRFRGVLDTAPVQDVVSGDLYYDTTSGLNVYTTAWQGTSGSGTYLPLVGGTMTGTITLKAGTTTVAPIKFVSGTNLTSAVAGVAEFDGTNLYFSV